MFYYLGLSVIHSDESLMLTLKAIGFDPKITGINFHQINLSCI